MLTLTSEGVASAQRCSSHSSYTAEICTLTKEHHVTQVMCISNGPIEASLFTWQSGISQKSAIRADSGEGRGGEGRHGIWVSLPLCVYLMW